MSIYKAQFQAIGQRPPGAQAIAPSTPPQAQGQGRALTYGQGASQAHLAPQVAPWAPKRRSELEATAEPAPGLVNLSTSQTDPETLQESPLKSFDIDPKVSRLKKLAFKVRQAAGMHTRSHSGWAPAMFTFTARAGQAVEANDFRDCLQNFRNWAHRKLGIRNLPYVWCAEMQENRARNGAPLRECVHYHLLVWLPPELKRKANRLEARGLRASGALPKPDLKGWWNLGSTERDWVRKNAVAYISKYLSKGTEIPFPKGIRLHGAGGFHAGHKQERHISSLPGWLRKQVEPTARCARAEGGGWVHRGTGEHFQSPWLAIFMGTFIRLVQREAQCESPISESLQPAMAS